MTRAGDKLDQLMGAMIDEALHPAAQLTVVKAGEVVYDWSGGTLDDGRAVTADTLFQIRSTTKALTTMVMLHCHDQGYFGFDDPVAAHWPGFAANGKAGITIAQVMSHSAGIPDGPDIRARDMHDVALVRQAVEAMRPVWAPGEQHGYHAASMGWVADELIRRWTGCDTATMLRRVVTEPLGVDEVSIGLDGLDYDRMAKMVVDPEERRRRAGRAAFSDFVNTEAGIRLPLNWVMGLATARALARIFSLLAAGGSLAGHTVFSAATLGHAMQPLSPPGNIDARLNQRIEWGFGFILGGSDDIYGSLHHEGAVGHAGGGASMAYADTNRDIAVAFLCNRMLGRESWTRYRRVADAVDEFVEALN